jgi:hypothetical protein
VVVGQLQRLQLRGGQAQAQTENRPKEADPAAPAARGLTRESGPGSRLAWVPCRSGSELLRPKVSSRGGNHPGSTPTNTPQWVLRGEKFFQRRVVSLLGDGLRPKTRRRVGPPRATRIGLGADVEVTDARNAESRIALGVSDRCARREVPKCPRRVGLTRARPRDEKGHGFRTTCQSRPRVPSA